MLLDEPFTGLDAASRQRLTSALAELADEGLGVCCALHELDLARTAFRRVIGLDRTILVDGPSEQVLSGRGLQVLFGIRDAA